MCTTALTKLHPLLAPYSITIVLIISKDCDKQKVMFLFCGR